MIFVYFFDILDQDHTASNCMTIVLFARFVHSGGSLLHTVAGVHCVASSVRGSIVHTCMCECTTQTVCFRWTLQTWEIGHGAGFDRIPNYV